MIYLQLFYSFCKIGLFSIGGGYAILPLVQQVVVEKMGWLSMGEFSDIITISQMTPGPIALNAASFVGLRTAGEFGTLPGIFGATMATAGCVFPSFVIVLFVAYMYYKYRSLSVIDSILYGIRPSVVSLIASAGAGILIMTFWTDSIISLETFDYVALLLFIISFSMLRIFKKSLNPICVILLSGLVGLLVYSVI